MASTSFQVLVSTTLSLNAQTTAGLATRMDVLSANKASTSTEPFATLVPKTAILAPTTSAALANRNLHFLRTCV